MGKEIKNKFNESINKIKDNINNIDEKDIKKENIEILEIGEARRQGDESLLSITNEWLKARVFGEVPKRLQGARSTKPNRCKLA